MSGQTPQQESSLSPLEYINMIESFLAKHAKDFQRINTYEGGELKEVKFVTVFLNIRVLIADKQVRIIFSNIDTLYLEEGFKEFGLAFNSNEGFKGFFTVRGFDFAVEVNDEDGKTRLVIRLIVVGDIEESEDSKNADD